MKDFKNNLILCRKLSFNLVNKITKTNFFKIDNSKKKT